MANSTTKISNHTKKTSRIINYQIYSIIGLSGLRVFAINCIFFVIGCIFFTIISDSKPKFWDEWQMVLNSDT